ncbi:unnamed protein product [Phytophthora lilii]|uniref:Unnamed protein product n=1 Tax=Phytophthora lilii TaxID=2077276 RepID=A0A9W6XP84_9STRA|nr:unnamed protein product [Phytophthora lilii]
MRSGRGRNEQVSRDKEESDNFLFLVGGESKTTKSSDKWLVDSGAPQHMTYSKEYMKNYKKMSPVDVHLADDGVVQAVGTGDIVMSMKTSRGTKKGVLTNLWHPQVVAQPVFGRALYQGCWSRDLRDGRMLRGSKGSQVEARRSRRKKTLQAVHDTSCA